LYTKVLKEGISVFSEVRFLTIYECELWNYNTVPTELHFVRILIKITFVLNVVYKSQF